MEVRGLNAALACRIDHADGPADLSASPDNFNAWNDPAIPVMCRSRHPTKTYPTL
jgi:hypothetical protein